MKIKIQVGDVVESLKGRDKGELLLVVKVLDGKAKTVDGRVRKVKSPKLKNPKHLKVIYPTVLKELAEKISNGNSVGNERVKKAILAVKEKI